MGVHRGSQILLGDRLSPNPSLAPAFLLLRKKGGEERLKCTTTAQSQAISISHVTFGHRTSVETLGLPEATAHGTVFAVSYRGARCWRGDISGCSWPPEAGWDAGQSLLRRPGSDACCPVGQVWGFGQVPSPH